MLTADAIRYFGSRYKIGRALQDAGIEIHCQAVYGWGENVPELRQLQLDAITGGKLKPAPGIKPKRQPEPVAA